MASIKRCGFAAATLFVLLNAASVDAAKANTTKPASQHAATTTEAATSTAVEATTETVTTPVNTTDTILNTRYCEIIPFTYQLYTYQCANKTITVNATLKEVYNTQGHSNCPESAWANITEESANEAYGAYYSELNGPRWWTLDHIQAGGTSAGGVNFTYPGLAMTRRAVMLLDPKAAKMAINAPPQYYKNNTIGRDTTYLYYPGTYLFKLIDNDGNEYLMQTYTNTINTTLTYDLLPTIGDSLDLPEGWSYSAEITNQTYYLSTVDNQAQLIRDNYGSSYQYIQNGYYASD